MSYAQNQKKKEENNISAMKTYQILTSGNIKPLSKCHFQTKSCKMI